MLVYGEGEREENDCQYDQIGERGLAYMSIKNMKL